ncbi:MAG: transposase [Muribaculaceae bacterium]|nr:transposase [Muribaculaceae bacterium]
MEQYRKTPRSRRLDYNSGDYFITICTKQMVHYFGEIHDGVMHLSEIGRFVERQLMEVEKYSELIEIPVFVVMPNHIHAIICVGREPALQSTDVECSQRAPNPALRSNPQEQRAVPLLSRYINSLKGSVTKYAKNRNIKFCWQPRYHDHQIRGKRDGNNIADYINHNVDRWNDDCFNRPPMVKPYLLQPK